MTYLPIIPYNEEVSGISDRTWDAISTLLRIKCLKTEFLLDSRLRGYDEETILIVIPAQAEIQKVFESL